MKPFWWGLLVSSITAYPIYCLLLKLNSRQKVSEFAPETHQAKQGTPTMGGLIFVLPVVVVALFLAWIHPTALSDFHAITFYLGRNPAETGLSFWWIPLVFLFSGFAVIGFIDDFVVPRLWTGKRGLGWKQKLGMQFIVALLYSLWVTSQASGAVTESGPMQVAVDILAILACANAYNFADGLDGLASSIALLLIPGLIAANSTSGSYAGVSLLNLLGGALLPFAFLNAPKAKVFMGDVGSLAVGALLGASFAAPFHAANFSRPVDYWVGLGVLSLVLLAELLPVPLQILWVKLFKRRLFPFTPIHHAFEKAGWQETRVVAMFALVQLVCTLGAIELMRGYAWGLGQG